MLIRGPLFDKLTLIPGAIRKALRNDQGMGSPVNALSTFPPADEKPTAANFDLLE
jgi:hypothetical protein